MYGDKTHSEIIKPHLNIRRAITLDLHIRKLYAVLGM